MKERILQLIKDEGLNIEEFFTKINVSYGNFKGKSKNSTPGADIIVKIFTEFPNVNLEWLLTGKGDRFSRNINVVEEPRSIYGSPKNQLEEKERSIIYLEKFIKDKEELIFYKNDEIERLKGELNAMKSRQSLSKTTNK